MYINFEHTFLSLSGNLCSIRYGNGPRQNIYSNVTHLFLGKELHEKSIGHEQEKIKGTLYNLESAQNSSQSHNTLTGLDTI